MSTPPPNALTRQLSFSTMMTGYEPQKVSDFVQKLKENGLNPATNKDIAAVISQLESQVSTSQQQQQQQQDRSGHDCSQSPTVDSNLLRQLSVTYPVIKKHLRSELAIPNFKRFRKEVEDLYHQAMLVDSGHVANYIPQLAKANPNHFAVSICTIDGQQLNFGNYSKPFCAQSVSKSITYCVAMEELGQNKVHQHVGREPSGRMFNAYELNRQKIPFNPMVNSGAIATASLIKTGEPVAERYEAIHSVWRRLSADSDVGFDNTTYQSERATSDRNKAISYLLKESGVFPPNNNLSDTLDLYFQCCSIQVTSEQLAIVAATLANGGMCPIGGERIFQEQTVRNCLSLMLSCGLYDFSGEWAFTVGLPAKSGVSGAIMAVVPNLMGIVTWSPPLDRHGNSTRGIAFCQLMEAKFHLHTFERSRLLGRKDDDGSDEDQENARSLEQLTSILYAISSNSMDKITRIVNSGFDLNTADYDGRTPLHLAASDGKLEIVKYFISQNAAVDPKDRWGNTPLDDARRGHFTDVIETLVNAGATAKTFRGGEGIYYQDLT